MRWGGNRLLWELQRRGAGEISGLKPEDRKALAALRGCRTKRRRRGAPKGSTIEAVGNTVVDLARDLYEQVSFLGQIAVISLKMMRRPRELRWQDFWMTYERAGVQALVVVGLISFLDGSYLGVSGSSAAT